MCDFMQRFDQECLILSGAVGAGYFVQGYDVGQIKENLDMVNVMTYDLCWKQNSNDHQTSMEYVVRFIDRGQS